MKTALDAFVEKHTVIRNGEKAPDKHGLFFIDQSPKQRLLMLRDGKFLTKLQTRACTLAFDAMVRDGKDPEKAFRKVVRQVAAGKLALRSVVDKEAKGNLRTLSDIRSSGDSFGPKQQLLELREAGSLSPANTKKAAQLLAQGRTIEQALCELEHEHLLGEGIPVPGAVDETGDHEGDGEGAGGEAGEGEPGDQSGGDAPGGPEGGSGTEGETEGDSKGGEVPRSPTPNLTIADVVKLRIGELADAIAGIKAKPAVIQILLEEEAKAKPRSGALTAIQDRLDELGVTEAELDGARKTAGQSTKLVDQEAATAGDFEEE